LRKGLLLALALLAGPALAQQDSVIALRAASEQIESATAALAQTEASDDRVAALSDTIVSLENGLASMRLALRASVAVAEEKREALGRNHAELGHLLATLGKLENTPTQLLVLHPDGALASVRAGIVLAALTPELRGTAQNLRQELDAINALNVLHADALANLKTALQTLQQARGELTEAIREERTPPANPTDSVRNLEQLVRASDDLNDFAMQLVARLPQERQPPNSPFISLRGQLPLPVNGTLARGYNMANGAGVRQPGIVLSAPSLSLVRAPQSGIVRYAGDFMEYGQVVILEPAPQQLQIYAGFGQVYVSTADVLESGAAMGLLGGEMPDSAEFLAESTGENDKGTESLYIEIRENGIPVNPRTWFAVN